MYFNFKFAFWGGFCFYIGYLIAKRELKKEFEQLKKSGIDNDI